MIELQNLSQEEIIFYIVEHAKLLKQYSLSAKKSSQARFEAPLWVSRAKVTTLNARMERNHEMLERIKNDLKEAIQYL